VTRGIRIITIAFFTKKRMHAKNMATTSSICSMDKDLVEEVELDEPQYDPLALPPIINLDPVHPVHPVVDDGRRRSSDISSEEIQVSIKEEYLSAFMDESMAAGTTMNTLNEDNLQNEPEPEDSAVAEFQHLVSPPTPVSSVH